MKICHVCSAHSVDDSRVFHRACVTLARAGYDVHLIAHGKREAPYMCEGVTIHPLKKAKSRIKRLANRSHIARIAADLHPDLFHVHEPELLGPVIARSRSIPVIWDVHESYTNVLLKRDWIPRRARSLVARLWDIRERNLLKDCAAVVAVSDRIAQRYIGLSKRVIVVSNYPEISQFPQSSARRENELACVFAGGLAPKSGLKQVIDAIALLKTQERMIVRLEIAGLVTRDYLRELFDHARSLDVDQQLTYHGVLSWRESLALQSCAHIGIATYLPNANTEMTISIKMIECMALGLPLVFSHFDNFVEIAGKSGAGIAVDPMNVNSVAAAIYRLATEPETRRTMGLAARQAVFDKYNWEKEKPKLLRLYEQILQ